jgi:hypothetical protein
MTTALPRPARFTLFTGLCDAIHRLARHAVALYSAPTCRTTAPAHAFCWLVALASVLAGDRFYLPTPKRPQPDPAPTKRPQRFSRHRPYTDDDRERAQIGRIRHAFATVPLGALTERIARRLGLAPEHELWPHGLAHITQTTVEFVAPPQTEAQTPPQPPAPQPPKRRSPQPTAKRPGKPIPRGVNSS